MSFFSFFKESPSIKVDIHSHLLPNIDDGVQTLKDSIAIIKKFKMLGYSKLITTPHIISDFYPNTKEIITEKLEEVKDALKKEEVDIILEAGAEYYVDMKFLDFIEDDNLLPFMDHYILFETSYSTKPIILETVIDQLISKGYIPVLAHPERYIYLYHDMEAYRKLKRQGVMFQVNIKSLYDSSKMVYKMAVKLMNAKLVDFVGSDTHRMHDVVRLEKLLKSREYKKMLRKNLIRNNIFLNK